jgi:glycosyltransferase involved in cell wall biosynthesis
MACGKTVIAPPIEGFEILEENEAGMLIDPKNTERFAELVVKLLLNPERREKMGQKGRQVVVNDFSWGAAANKTMAIINEIKKR